MTTLTTISGLIQEVIGEDWDLEEEITLETTFSEDLELESIEFVALAEKMQNTFGDEVNFVSWLSEKELDEVIDLKVGDVVEFIDACRT
jgi:acyl carrier protein